MQNRSCMMDDTQNSENEESEGQALECSDASFPFYWLLMARSG